jgi:hypothetical protein
MLFDLIGDREIFHRDVALALNVAEQLVATHPESSRALTGCEICSYYPKPDGPFATHAGCSCPGRRMAPTDPNQPFEGGFRRFKPAVLLK